MARPAMLLCTKSAYICRATHSVAMVRGALAGENTVGAITAPPAAR